MSVFSQGVDIRHYSKQVELELQQIEQKSIRDCILQQRKGGVLLKWGFVECGADSLAGGDLFSLRVLSPWGGTGEALQVCGSPSSQRGPLTFCGSDIQESENIASLHNQITACDAVLEVRNHDL